LRIGSEQNPALVIESVQVDYTPRGLYQKKIEKITLSGMELYGDITHGEFKLRDLDIGKFISGVQQQEKPAAISDGPSPLVAVTRLEIRHSQVIVEYNDQIYRLPFEFDIIPQDPEFNIIDIAAFLYPRGEKITATASMNRHQRRVVLNIDFATLNLDRFADLSSRIADLMLSGEMTMHGKAVVLWEPLRISVVNASLTLRNSKIRAGGVQLQNAMAAKGEEIPIRIDLAGQKDNEWRFSGSKISMVAPTPLTLAGFDGIIKKIAGTLESSGNFTAVLHQSTQTGFNPLPVKIQEPLPLQGRFSATFHQSGKWQCEISNNQSKSTSAKKVKFSVEPYSITASIPEFNLSATSESEKINAAYMLRAPGVRIASASESIQIPELKLKGTAQIATGTDGAFGVTIDLRAPKTVIKLESAEVKISDVSLSGKLNMNDNRLISLDGEIQFDGTGGRFPNLNAQFSGARGKIPFEWPVKGKTAKGSVSVTNLKYKDMNLGGLKGQIRQTATGFAFAGRHQSALLPRMKLNFTGESRLFIDAPAGAGVHVELSRPADAPEIDLGRFYPDAKGIRIKGKFQLDGDLALNINGFSGMIRADFNNGTLLLDKNNFALEGIRMSLSLPELPKIRSSSGQQIHFTKISLGDFVAEKGRIDFQIESARSILIEKMHFLWCDGNVETQSMRLSPGAEDYHITFYCDRLNLAKVLEQFGAAAAKGQGSVNGRIPLQYANGKIKFDDGFLFSTPGEGGKIHLSGTDILTAGIPPNTPQYVQIELAREALKDYVYSWAKLNITSKGEELLLQMQMDGKPAKTLPFVYKKDIGGFIKVEADAKGSKFQGIRLDVNFRLPLNKLLQYKDLINMIE